MRFFPSAARHRVALACTGVVTVAAIVVPFAHADDRDDLRDRRRDVQSRIADASADLKEASRQVTRSSRRLVVTQARLELARDQRSEVRARLSSAIGRNAQLKVELAEAEEALDEARAAAKEGRADVRDQRRLVRQTAISIYTTGDPTLRALGELADAGSIEEMETVQLGHEVLSSRQTTIFNDLEVVEAQLVAEKDDVAAFKAKVADKKAEAAAHLETMQGLYAEAAAAAERVQGLVGDARSARRAAYRARAHDRKVLRQLRAREKKIEARLVALARAQRNQRGFTGASDGYLSYPASGPVTSPYGYRTHPIYGYYSLHNGTDFGTGCGAPLYASAGGTVLDTYYDSVYGNRLFLSLGKVNGKSLVLIYNHLSAYRVSEGARIERGTVVGLSGTTGWSTGCHLHFTVMADGTAVDPMTYL